MLQTEIVTGAIGFEGFRAYSTYVHETIHWWQHVGTTTGLYRGRPVDVAMTKDGSMLISDDFAGALYRVTYTGDEVKK